MQTVPPRPPHRPRVRAGDALRLVGSATALCVAVLGTPAAHAAWLAADPVSQADAIDCDAVNPAYGLTQTVCGTEPQRLPVQGDGSGFALGPDARPRLDLAAAGVNDVPLATGPVRPTGALADARWLTDWGRFYLRAGLAPGSASRVVARSFGWQVDDPARRAALQVGGFVGARSALLPALPIVGARYATTSATPASAAAAPMPRFSDVWRSLQSDGSGFASGLGAPSAPVSFGSEVPFVGRAELKVMAADVQALQAASATPDTAAPAPLLKPGVTDFALEAGRLSDDPLRVEAGRDLVVASSVRHGLNQDYTISATALRVGPTRMWGAASDMRLGPVGLLRAGVALLDAGDGAHPRSIIGHDFQADGLTTRVRLEQRYGGRTDSVDLASQSPAALAALPDDRHNRAGTASLALSPRTQLVLAGLDREPQQGEAARWVSVGASYAVSRGSQVSVAVQRAVLPEETNRLLVSWMVPLDTRSATGGNANRALRRGWSDDGVPAPGHDADAPVLDESVEQAVASVAQQ